MIEYTHMIIKSSTKKGASAPFLVSLSAELNSVHSGKKADRGSLDRNKIQLSPMEEVFQFALKTSRITNPISCKILPQPIRLRINSA